jgi:hypothetical protein
MVVQFYIYINSAQVFQLLHVCVHTYHLCVYLCAHVHTHIYLWCIYEHHPNRYKVWFWLVYPWWLVTLATSSHAWWPFVYHLYKSIYSCPLSIFFLLFIFIVLLGGGKLWHLQKFLQYIILKSGCLVWFGFCYWVAEFLIYFVYWPLS